MSNKDRFDMAEQRGDYIEAAKLAIHFGRHKNSRNGAWSWADEAVRVATLAGKKIEAGRLSWPDFDLMESGL